MTVVKGGPESYAVSALDRDRHGRPIPWFVMREADGTPDFRVIKKGAVPEAVRFGLCWVCGRARGRHAAFVVGPMCGVNRVGAEPPSHLDCAVYSARACPFLVTPTMVRRERNLPEDRVEPPGRAVLRNPGVVLVWSSRTWAPYRCHDGSGVLFDLGEPSAVRWYAQGRDATRAEVTAAVVCGLPVLQAACHEDRDPADSLSMLDQQVSTLMRLVPA